MPQKNNSPKTKLIRTASAGINNIEKARAKRELLKAINNALKNLNQRR